MLAHVGFVFDLAKQGLIWNLKHDELLGHMPNLNNYNKSYLYIITVKTTKIKIY